MNTIKPLEFLFKWEPLWILGFSLVPAMLGFLIVIIFMVLR